MLESSVCTDKDRTKYTIYYIIFIFTTILFHTRYTEKEKEKEGKISKIIKMPRTPQLL